MSGDGLLQRFLRYVQVDTTACADAKSYPSSPGQLDLGRMLVEELCAAGLADARQDQFGIVTATIPASEGVAADATAAERAAGAARAPTIAWCAHLDTSPETSGKNVRPQVIERYAGGPIVLSGAPSQVIRPEEHPELNTLHGRTLVTSDGTTLLGADDKAGVAVIMEAAERLLKNPAARRGPVRICFTCDEEIGHGVDHIDLAKLGAAVCYTLDGQGADTVDVETFSADLAAVTVRGVNVHPGVAKGVMVNAIRAAADFIARLPRGAAPETTDGRQGFLHPYDLRGGVAEVKMQVLLRDFRSAALADWAGEIRRAAEATQREFPGVQIQVDVTPQYRNMSEGLAREPRAVEYAEEALRRLGRTPRRTIVRGGTDGSRLTELGLPSPNLAAGQHCPHSRQEWACLDEMAASVEWLVALAEVWAESR